MTRISLAETAHQFIIEHLKVGDAAIDATLGNGHDALFLAQTIGVTGQLFGFDIQETALSNSRERLKNQHIQTAVTLFQTSHAEMLTLIPQQWHGNIQAIMFNLGYLPGADKTLITQATSTLTALNAACQLLAEQGVLTVMAYPGHVGGDDETQQLATWCQRLDPQQFSHQLILSHHDKPTAPRLFVIRKRCYLL
ncbi:MAG: class I SAM-dependent methyltransferase [Methylomonas sp.]